ncbi:MAG: hypothetical protein N3A38_14310 [Planctomycetota bacterium]|nr:hypothetical protein [Planctomycetota bacterium]
MNRWASLACATATVMCGLASGGETGPAGGGRADAAQTVKPIRDPFLADDRSNDSPALITGSLDLMGVWYKHDPTGHHERPAASGVMGGLTLVGGYDMFNVTMAIHGGGLSDDEPRWDFDLDRWDFRLDFSGRCPRRIGPVSGYLKAGYLHSGYYFDHRGFDYDVDIDVLYFGGGVSARATKGFGVCAEIYGGPAWGEGVRNNGFRRRETGEGGAVYGSVAVYMSYNIERGLYLSGRLGVQGRYVDVDDVEQNVEMAGFGGVVLSWRF